MTGIDRRSRGVARLRLASIALVVASGIGLAAISGAPGARAVDGELTDTAVTVKWAGGNDPQLQQYQPDRSHMVDDADGSGHWNDFKDLELTVSKTQNLRDETVSVWVSGFAETTFPDYPGASNFVQVMQCWGDPRAADFAETCQFGAWDAYTGDSRAAEVLQSLNAGATFTREAREHLVPFRSVVGSRSEVQEISGGSGTGTIEVNGIAQFFTASSSNEVPIGLVDDDGTAEIPFTMQTAAAQPYLGCGDPSSAAGEQCWLVVVPRGTHSGTLEGAVERCGGATAAGNAFGQARSAQTGSPLSPNCSFWADRIVIPLQFANAVATCPAGAVERGMVGSELVADAVTSWQPTLCAGEDGTAFNLSTAPGGTSRTQLLGGQTDLALVAEPLTRDTIGSADPGLLEQAEFAYAPVANTAVTIGFVASSFRRLYGPETYHELKLTPRLVAKLLTQSYRTMVPGYETFVGDSREHLRHERVTEDEEWIALANPQTFRTLSSGAWVVPGPHGDDAIRTLWDYVLADADAVAFLRGEPDPWGNTVNRYYLPPAHQDAAGGGFDLLSDPLDAFPRADQTYAPDAAVQELKNIRSTFDSIAMMPYSGSLTANSVRIRNGDLRLTQEWDPNKFNTSGDVGDWVPTRRQSPANGQFVLGPATASASENYQIDSATLALPSTEQSSAENLLESKTFVAYGPESMRAAVDAQTLDEYGVASLDLADLPHDAYPLTMTLNAAVDLASGRLDSEARADYASFLDYVATTGNTVSDARGSLPPGYLPLTGEQADATLALAERLRAGTSVTEPGSAAAPAPSSSTDTAASTVADTQSADSAGGVTDTRIADTAGSTPQALTASASVPAQGALGATLVTGLAGTLASGFLLRRRRT